MSASAKAVTGLVAAVLCLAGIAGTRAQQGDAPRPTAGTIGASDLGFLEAGKAYAIRFAQRSGPFQTQTSEMVVPECVVKRLGGRSWALLEVPTDVGAATDRMLARLALKNPQLLAEVGKTSQGRERITAWKKEAASEVVTTEAWVNLAHAILIEAPFTDPKDPRLNSLAISDWVRMTYSF